MNHPYDLNFLTTRWRELADGAWLSLCLAVIPRALFVCMHPSLIFRFDLKEVFPVSTERAQGQETFAGCCLA